MTAAPPSASLWLAALDESRGSPGGDLLAADELARAATIRHLGARRRFVAGRLLARYALSRAATVDPADWRFRLASAGRPEIAKPATAAGLRFNLSHGDGLVACVVTREIACGVDVEHLGRRVDALAIARHSFSAAECAALERLPEAERHHRFFSLWTLKEAYLKALGTGIRLRLDAVTFAFSAPRTVTARITTPDDEDSRGWYFGLYEPSDQHLLALALRLGAPGRPSLEVGRLDLESGAELPGPAVSLRASST